MYARELEHPGSHLPGTSAQLSFHPMRHQIRNWHFAAPIRHPSRADKPTTFCEVKICKPSEDGLGLVQVLHE